MLVVEAFHFDKVHDNAFESGAGNDSVEDEAVGADDVVGLLPPPPPFMDAIKFDENEKMID